MPEHRVRCFNAGIIQALLDCLKHEDIQVQKTAAENFAFLASDAAGCNKLLEEDAVVSLLDATDNEDPGATLACFDSLIAAAKKASIRAFFLSNHNLLTKLLEIAKDLVNPAKAASALKLLHLILEGRNNEDTVEFLLNSDAVQICTNNLKSDDVTLKHAASTVLAFLAVSGTGKLIAVAANAVQLLVDLADTTNPELQYSSSSCLMALAVANAGKDAIHALDQKKLKKVVQTLLDSRNEFIVMNTFQFMAAAAEHEQVRTTLKPFVNQLLHMKPTLPKYVSHHLAFVVRQLTFKSLPYEKLVH